jgi:hypothetical protein
MKPSGELLRKMLSDLKTRQGASLGDLEHFLPERYRFMDYDPRYLVLETIVMLVEWGLVEVYDGKRLLTAIELKAFDRWRWPENVTVYISKQTFEMEEALGIRLDSAGGQVFNTDRLAHYRDWPDVFVLMPFDPVMKPVYEDHVVPVVKSLQLKIGRADDFFTNGHIMSEVWAAITRASIIIADCTKRNPNVFYEIGIAHAVGKETILIAQSMDDIPFDLRHLRVIEYRYDPRGMKQFEEALKKTITTLRSSRTQPPH